MAHLPSSSSGGDLMGRLYGFVGLLILALALAPGPAKAERFRFAALGDMNYSQPRDQPRYASVIAAVNREKPAFSIHVGDFKGYTSCADEQLLTLSAFDRFDSAVFYTPGDNEWADCGGGDAGGFDPLERLDGLRRLFFSTDLSLGAKPLPLARQTGGTPENVRWTSGSVVFVTVHATGPHNNFVPGDERMARDAMGRIQSGKAWLREAFTAARASRAPALVIAFHADPFIASAAIYEDGPLDWIRQIVREEAATFPGQVLLVHGDTHRFTVDQPFRRTDVDRGVTTGLNVTRLMVPGWPDHRAVLVEVDTATPGVFAFRPLVGADEAAGAKP